MLNTPWEHNQHNPDGGELHRTTDSVSTNKCRNKSQEGRETDGLKESWETLTKYNAYSLFGCRLKQTVKTIYVIIRQLGGKSRISGNW